jgi:hypothetical protein
MTIKLNSSGGGSASIVPPVTASTLTFTLPTTGGEIAVGSAAPTTQQVLDATAGATAGAVGTYVLAGTSSNLSFTFGATISGSSLRAASIVDTNGVNWTNVDLNLKGVGSSTSLSGTWRALGQQTWGSGFSGATIWLRIS